MLIVPVAVISQKQFALEGYVDETNPELIPLFG